MHRDGASRVWAILLVLAGSLFLLNNYGILQLNGDMFVGALFAAGGAAFLLVFLMNRAHWWAAIPGFTLLSLGALIGWNDWLPSSLGGSLFLGGIGLGFWAIFLTGRQGWWPIIPGGALLSLAAVAWVGENIDGFDAGGILFLGLSATFWLVYLAGLGRDNTRWAAIPATALLIVGLVITAAQTVLLDYVWPVIMILAGVWLLVRPRHRPAPAAAHPPAPLAAPPASEAPPAAVAASADAEPGPEHEGQVGVEGRNG